MLFVSQEMALEIVCRIAHFVIAHDRAFLQQSLASFPAGIAESLTQSSTSISDLLVDMRPCLNRLNEPNPRIFSAAFTAIKISAERGIDRTVDGAGWVDICEEVICFHLLELQLFVRLDVGSVLTCASAPSPATYGLKVCCIHYCVRLLG